MLENPNKFVLKNGRNGETSALQKLAILSSIGYIHIKSVSKLQFCLGKILRVILGSSLGAGLHKLKKYGLIWMGFRSLYIIIACFMMLKTIYNITYQNVVIIKKNYFYQKYAELLLQLLQWCQATQLFHTITQEKKPQILEGFQRSDV